VQNVGGFRVQTPAGDPVTWRRDDAEPWRFYCQVPEGADAVEIQLDYIANQETVNSDGVGAQGNSFIGAINFNVCLVYPEGYKDDELTVELRVKLPPKWKYATALKTKEKDDQWITFEPTTLRTVIDSPLICGEHFRSIDLEPKDTPPAWLHLTSESPTAIQISDELIGKYRRLIEEANALFGRAPHEEYHFLVTLSDDLGANGLEHLASSLNGLEEREFVDEELLKGWWASYLLAHEYAHAWCGKYRRPSGMTTHDFHSPQHTELLWIYEGLTQYLGEVLAVRAGLQTVDRHREALAMTIGQLDATKGRRWRPLADTASASHQLRGYSRHWAHLRRSQDYYDEGALYWLEADAIIREATNGEKSLDDFCRLFFGKESDLEVNPFDLEEVYEALDDVTAYDWKAFFEKRVYLPQDELPLDAVGRIGYRLEFSTEPSEAMRDADRRYGGANATDSLGLSALPDGTVMLVLPGSPADRAGLASGQEIQGVNGRRFSPQRLRDAIADSTTQRNVELLMLQGDRFRTVTIEYDGGLRYRKLVRNPDEPHRLAEILKAKKGGTAEE
jgi:predicted metalloprotease with PDZ domain